MKIYFAGSIRGGRDDKALYLEIIGLLRNYGTVLTEHIGDVRLMATGEALKDRSIHDRDLSWLQEADYVVGEVTVPSLGVGYELGKATEWGKKIVCLFRPSEGASLSAMIAGSSTIKTYQYQTLSELRYLFDNVFGQQETSARRAHIR